MTRTLPIRMHRKECEILVEAAFQYFEGTLGPGESVAKIWDMHSLLRSQVIACRSVRDVVATILGHQHPR